MTVCGPTKVPAGGLNLWIPLPPGVDDVLLAQTAREAGVLVSPGEFYGPAGAAYVRVALVQPLERLELVVDRLGGG